VRFAGPLLEGGSTVGSVVVFEAESLAAAQRFAAADPYVVHGVFASHELRETKDVLAELLA
jgi:uncharacterized protein YciI